MVHWCNGAVVHFKPPFMSAVQLMCWRNGAMVHWCNGAMVHFKLPFVSVVQLMLWFNVVLVHTYVGALMQWFVCLSVWRSVALSVCLSESLPIPLVCHLPLEMANPRTLDRRWCVNNDCFNKCTYVRNYTVCRQPPDCSLLSTLFLCHVLDLLRGATPYL